MMQPQLAVLLLIATLELTSVGGQPNGEIDSSPDRSGLGADEERYGSDLSVAASDSSILTTRSHRILTAGWPSTSQMWPSIQVADEQVDNSTHWSEMIEPFIYADKPRSNDYSLLLSMNKTILSVLKSHTKPMAIDLSFEYYFSYDQKITAPPGMKIEVDRKQFKYLEPDGQSIKPNVWLKLNEKIIMTELARLDNSDWLKISLINRQTPSLVALRHLRVEFILDDGPSHGQLLEPQAPAVPMINKQGELSPAQIQLLQQDQPKSNTPPPPTPPVPVSGDDIQNQPKPQPPKQPIGPPILEPAPVQPVAQPPPLQPSSGELPVEGDLPQQEEQPLNQARPWPPQEEPPIDYDRGNAKPPLPPPSRVVEYTEDRLPESSNDVSTKVKPDDKDKKSNWNIWGRRRRKRDTAIGGGMVLQANGTTEPPRAIVLTCFQADGCQWRTESSEQIQWSLARMPPSTRQVQSGYFYVSNRNNYGDSSRMLHLWLNQTESATIADQNSDHCLELAIYVTEGSYLNLYHLKRSSMADEVWVKGNKLLSWSPTMAIAASSNRSNVPTRTSVPKSQLAAMIDGHNGWTFETLCYGDFFSSVKDSTGLYAFGFEMASAGSQRHQQEDASQQSLSEPYHSEEIKSPETPDEFTVSSTKVDEQVVGVAVLQEYTNNVPLRGNRQKWLETWQRVQVKPDDDWKFYPKLDCSIGTDNVSLMNMFDNAHYYIQSDWLNVDQHLDFMASLAIEPVTSNETLAKIPELHDQLANTSPQITDIELHDNDNIYVFALKINMKLVDANFNLIFGNTTIYHLSLRNNETQFVDLNSSLTDNIIAARQGQLQREHDSSLFKVILEFVLDTHWIQPNSSLEQLLVSNGLTYKISLANISLSDRCYPNPCQYGTCQQNGTGFEDWTCECDEQHRGRRCEFGRWCNLPHIAPWNPINNKNPITLKAPQSQQQRQPKIDNLAAIRVSGKDYCQRKLGIGSRCTDIDLPLNDNLYTEEDRTFVCTCQDDYYLSDDSKCKSAHLCNSIVCPFIGTICDESKPFNQTQPCHCDEKQDWFPDPLVTSSSSSSNNNNRCIRRQCQDKQRDCQFDAHICLPTLPGEKPICKCGPKFTLRVNERSQKYCQSTACVLPTLNDCQQICQPDNSNLAKPYTCACHPGFTLEPDGLTCRPQRPHSPPNCKPACHGDAQICTDAGCRCKQGYVGEGEVRVQQVPKNRQISNNTIDYVQSIRCLNVCSLTYAENKDEFERIESVCPLGLCDPSDFHCRCADPSSSALIHTKYEPIHDDNSTTSLQLRTSPLCHLKRVCEPDSSGYKICRSRGAICVPDYTKAAMFDCVCPPSTERRRYGQETVSEFTCEPKCSSKRGECLRRQAVCKLVDRDEVKCECLPGFMFDQRDQKCYLAKYSYSFNLLVVNRYYEPEAKFHKLEPLNNSSGALQPRLFELNGHVHQQASNHLLDKPELNEISPQFNNNNDDVNRVASDHQNPSWKSIFITEYNQCNISQVIPKSVIDDPYEHDIESYLGYIDQCNEKIHQNVKTYHLNSRLSEDLRQSLRQHLRDFTVTTSNNSCFEMDPSGMYLNCTVYLQSNEPVQMSTVEFVLNDCDKHGQDARYCWIKPRLLLKKPELSSTLDHATTNTTVQLFKNELNFKQILACDINNFCGQDAFSVRTDDKTSLCSCKCPLDIEAIDVKDLELRNENEPTRVSVKEICAPRNLCGNNSTYCLGKAGSVCQYDIRTGSKCNCVYPSYEDSEGHCVEITFSPLDSTLIVIIIMLGTGLIVSIAINLAMVAKSKSVFGRSKQYPLNEFSSSSRPANRSTGQPNPVFYND